MNITKAMTAAEREQERGLTAAVVTLGARVRREGDLANPDAGLADLKLRLEKARLDLADFRTSLYASHPELKVQRGDASPVDVLQAARTTPRRARRSARICRDRGNDLSVRA